jgi:hypothetical protein
MKTYELIVQIQQPSCGGKSPFRNEFRKVSVDDPVEYVRTQEPGGKLEVQESADGTITVSTMRNQARVVYEFSED